MFPVFMKNWIKIYLNITEVRFEKCISKSINSTIPISAAEEALLVDECLIIYLDLQFLKFDI